MSEQKGHHVSISNGKSSRAHSTTSFLLCFTLPILGSVTVSAGRAQTATPAEISDCRLSELGCPQDIRRDESSVKTGKIKEPNAEGTPAIQDNSFLVEEAYNQEFGVVQHIQTFQRLWNSKDWVYTFTQEWPVDASPRNQLSYTLVSLHSGEHPETNGGVGDFVLNYRYQALGSGKAKLAFSPRVSLLLPTGDYRRARGAGSTGIQTQLPVSLVVTKKLVAHWNAGATLIPNARNDSGARAATFGYNLGQSFVWLVHPRFNFFLETVFYRYEDVIAPRRTQWSGTLLLNPGIRWAYNFKNGIQIVPGVAVPFGAGPSSGEKGVFLYLSLEHPYRKLPKG
jgi:Putative MetA-pathway of phenol degradation